MHQPKTYKKHFEWCPFLHLIPMLLIATHNGLLLDYEDGKPPKTVLAGQNISAVIAREGVILVGTDNGVLFSDDLGQHWRTVNTGLDDLDVRWLAYHPDVSDYELCGTQSGVYVSKDGAATWTLLYAIADTNAAQVVV